MDKQALVKLTSDTQHISSSIKELITSMDHINHLHELLDQQIKTQEKLIKEMFHDLEEHRRLILVVLNEIEHVVSRAMVLHAASL